MIQHRDIKRPPLKRSLRFDVLERDSFTCVYCGKTPPDAVLQIDHVHPVSAGGEDEIDNLVTSCRACNLGKSDRVGVAVPENPPGVRTTDWPTIELCRSFVGCWAAEEWPRPSGGLGWCKIQSRIVGVVERETGDHELVLEVFSWHTGLPTKVIRRSVSQLFDGTWRLFKTRSAFARDMGPYIHQGGG